MRACATSATSPRQHTLAIMLALSCPCAALPAPDPEDDLTQVPFEQLLTMQVFSASRFLQHTSEAPSAVSVVTRADIGSFGWRTLADVIRSMPGMTVSYDRNYSYLGARGFQRAGDYNTRFLLLVDGNRINDAVYDQAPAGAEFPLDLELIERIEFVPGPGSSVFGSNAVFGIINVITRKPQAQPEQRLTLGAASFGGREARASSAWRSAGGVDLVLGASRSIGAGQDLYFAEYDSGAPERGIARGLDWERVTRLYASASDGPFSVALLHGARRKGIPTASFDQPFNRAGSYTLDRQSYLSLAYSDALGLHEQLSVHAGLGRYLSAGDYLNQDGSLLRDGSAAAWWSAELRLESRRWRGHKVVAGIDLERDSRLDQFVTEKSSGLAQLDDHRSGRRAGAYLQDELALGRDWRLNLGLRHDRSSGQAGVTSPRAAVIVQLPDGATVKLVHGAAYRAPTSYEKYYRFSGPNGQLPNPALAPERVRSDELIVSRVAGEHTRLTATLFRNAARGLITLTEGGNGVTRFDNGRRFQSRGIEAEIERRWRSGALLRASVSQAHVSETGTGAPIDSGAPRRLAAVNLAAPLAGGWQGGLEVLYAGARQTPLAATGAYWLANLQLVSARWPGGDWSLGLYNLFDRRYADLGAPEHLQRTLAQDGRTLRLRWSHGF